MKTVTAPKGFYRRGKIWWLSFQRNKKRRHVSLETADLAEAITAAATIKAALMVETASTGTVEELIPQFLAEKVRNVTFSRATRDWSEGALNRFSAWLGKLTPAMVTEERVEKYRTWLLVEEGLKPTSVNSYLRALSSFLTWCVRRGHTVKNNAKHAELKNIKGHARDRYCTVVERDKLIAGAPTRDLALILHLGFYAGLRRNEIVEAAPDWVDLEQGVLHVKERPYRPTIPAKGDAPEVPAVPAFHIKNREQRTIPLHPSLKAFLETWPMEGPFLLQPGVRHGAARYRYDIRRPFEDYMVDAEMTWVTQHTMRHTFASILAQKGVSLYKIARWLGDTIKTTEKHYAHLQAQDEDIAPELRPQPSPSAGKAATPGSSGRKPRRAA